jgi:putative transposase
MEYKSLNHTQWECLYHVVFIPKRRRHTLYVELRKYLGEVFAGWRNRRKVKWKRAI